jgi:hypothetical protein
MTHQIWSAPLRALPGGRSTRAAPPAWARAEVRALDTFELHLLRSALARALSELPLGSPGSAAIGALSRAAREELALRELRRLSGSPPERAA